MADIIHRIGIKAPVAKVYEAVATAPGVAGWWTRDTTGTAKVGGTLNVRFRHKHGARGIHGALQHEVGDVLDESSRARRDREGKAGAGGSANR